MKQIMLIGLLVLLAGLVSSKSLQQAHLDLETVATNLKLYDQTVFADDEDAKLKVPALIAKYGYPIEVHNITTGDGYILQVHRIPYGKKCGPAEDKKVVWVQHGILGDSSNWVVAGPEKGLAYNLADECYDVWLGNYRGNSYSRRHITWDPDSDKEAFWSYSWHEIGMNDIPSGIDYVLEQTGVEQIYYIGHSMGTTGFWVAMSERPEYNSKIKAMMALAPVSFTEHMRSPIAGLAYIDGLIEWLLDMMGLYEFLPTSPLYDWLGQSICKATSPIQDICHNVLFLVAGYDFDQIDRELMTTILGHMPAGASVNCFLHFAQGVTSGEFRKFDYGSKKNRELYGQDTPPKYDVSKITVPVALWWGENDWLGVKDDVNRLAEMLPNIQLKRRINHDLYNHLDFLWAKDNIELLNQPLIKFLKNF